MKTILWTLPLLALLLIAPAMAEESAEEKRLGRSIEEAEQKLIATDQALRAARKPEEKKRLTADIQSLQARLAQLHQERETLRVAQVEQERKLATRITLHIDDLPLSTAVDLLRGANEVPITIAPAISARRVTLKLDDVPWREALGKLAKASECTAFFGYDPKGVLRIALWPSDDLPEGGVLIPGEMQTVDEADLGKFIPDSLRLNAASDELAKKLDTTKVTLQVDDVPLPHAVALLAKPWEINVAIDAKYANTRVSLDVKDVTLHEALELVGKAADLEVRLDGRLVRLVKPQSLTHWGHTHKGKGVKSRKGVLPPKWGFEWNQVHLEDLRRRLAKEKDPDKRADIEDEIRIREVIEKYRTSGLPQKNYSVIRVTMSFDDTPLSEAASRLAKAHGVEILVPRKLGERRISVDLKDRTLPAAVGGLALAAGGIASTSGRGLWVLWPVARLRPHHPIQKAARPPPRFRTQRADIRPRDPRRPPTPAEELRSLRDEIRALRAEIAEIKAILLRMR